MLSWMIIASFGIGSVAWFASLPPLWCTALAPLLVLLCTIVRNSYYTVLAIAIAGMAWGVIHGHRLIGSQLPEALEGQPVWVSGTVVGLPKTSPAQQATPGVTLQRFNFRVDGALCPQPSPDTSVCYAGVNYVRLSYFGEVVIKPGQRWRWQVSLKRIHSLANPGGFDYHTWLLQQSIGAAGYVRHHRLNQRLGDARWSIDRWRDSVASRLDRLLTDNPHSAIFKALLVGDKRAITAEQWQLYSRTGTIHLMVISGLHVGLISTLCFMVMRYSVLLVYRSGHADRFAAVMTVLVAMAYSMAAGLSLPTQRALVMVSVVMLALFSRRQMHPGQALATALLLCLLFDPLAPVSASFWLSFSAVGVLCFCSIGRYRTDRRQRIGWQAILHTTLWQSQYVVFIGLLPALMLWTAQCSVLAPVANLIAVPLFTVIIVPFTMLAAVISVIDSGSGVAIWMVLAQLLDWLLSGLVLLDSGSQVAVVDVELPSGTKKVIYMALTIAGIVMMLLPKGVPLRCYGVLLLIPLLVYSAPRPPLGAMQLHVLDVGQGLAIVVITRHHTLLYDVGAALDGDHDMVRSVIVPFLRTQSIDKLDRLVLSHGDNDHAGGWQSAIATLQPTQLDYGQWLDGMQLTGAMPCRQGQRWQWDGVSFEYLHPADIGLNQRQQERSSNNSSCVLKISTAGAQFLLTGDIERNVERELARTSRHKLQADVLIAPHHGSNTSSSWPLLKAVNPQHVVVSSGYRNRFGHPHQQVIARYQQLDITIHNTSAHGAVQFIVDSNQLLTVYHYRDRYQHYWYSASGFLAYNGH